MSMMSKIEHGEAAGKAHRQRWLISLRSCKQVTIRQPESRSPTENSRDDTDSGSVHRQRCDRPCGMDGTSSSSVDRCARSLKFCWCHLWTWSLLCMLCCKERRRLTGDVFQEQLPNIQMRVETLPIIEMIEKIVEVDQLQFS